MQSKRILITGASSGIGRAAALQFAEQGHHVLIAARRLDRLDALVEEARAKKFRGSLISAELDVANPETIRTFVRQHRDWLQEIDVLVNNAGLALGREAFQDGDPEDIAPMIETNVLGLLRLTREILPFMIPRQRGHILNLGSVAGRTAYGGGTTYCATKAAVHMITDALRIDLGGTGVRVSTVAPGRVETEFSLVRFKGDEGKAKKVYEGFRPLTAEDIARSIGWIVDQPEHVNIQELVILSTDQPSATALSPLKTR